MVKRPDRNAREQRQLARDYAARQTVHEIRLKRKARDNWIAAAAAILVCGAAIFAQYAYFNWGPGTPVPTPTDSATPSASDTPTGSGSLGTVERDDSLTAPKVDLGGAQPTVTLPAASVAAPSKVVVEVLEQGKGAKVKATQSVTVDYEGVNWTTAAIFDSSYSRGQSASFSLDGGVIPGFTQAIAGQRVGSTIVATLPSDAAYGDSGSSGDANTAGPLVFVIHIISAK